MPRPDLPTSHQELTLLGSDRTQWSQRECQSCGSPTGRWFSTSDGRAMLCPPCATLHGLGCP